MKKIKISMIAILAIVLGIAGSAFTSTSSSQKELASYYFEFTSSPTLANVTNPVLWHEVVAPTGCLGNDQKACKIKVRESKTIDNGAGNPRTLDPSIMIDASKFGTDIYFVLEGDDIEVAYNTLN